jgi:hypothetical protein
MAYRYILEEEHFNLSVPYDIEGDFNGDDPGTHNGLNLPQNVLDKIYYDNMVKFLACRYSTEDLEDIIKSSRLTFREYKTRAAESGSGDENLDTLTIELLIKSHNAFIAIDRDMLHF